MRQQLADRAQPALVRASGAAGFAFPFTNGRFSLNVGAGEDKQAANIQGTIDQTDYSPLWMPNLTGDGLTAYRRTAGGDGATLVPDLATAIPTAVELLRTALKVARAQLEASLRRWPDDPLADDDVARSLRIA